MTPRTCCTLRQAVRPGSFLLPPSPTCATSRSTVNAMCILPLRRASECSIAKRPRPYCVFIGRRSATLHSLAALIPAARGSDALPVAGRCMARSAAPAAAAAVSVAARSVSASVFMRAVATAAAAAPAAARAAGAAAATIHGSAAAGAASRNDVAVSAPAVDTQYGDEPPEVLPMRQAIQRATALPRSPEVEEAVLRFWTDRGLLLNEDQIDSATVRLGVHAAEVSACTLGLYMWQAPLRPC